MDYSLLVGIHDCTIPSSDESDEGSEDEEGVSGEDNPVTPTSLTSGTSTMVEIMTTTVLYIQVKS